MRINSRNSGKTPLSVGVDRPTLKMAGLENMTYLYGGFYHDENSKRTAA